MLHSTGFFLIAFTLLATVGILLTALDNVLEFSPYWTILGVVTVMLSVHLYRKDIDFLDNISTNRWEVSSLLFCEYVLLISPILIFHLIQMNYSVVASTVLSAMPIAIFYNKIKRTNRPITKRTLSLIPIDIFEVKFKVEQYPFVFFMLIGMSLLSFMHVAFLIGSLFLTVLFLIDAYNYSEPPEMIHWHQYFVLHKIKKTIWLVTLAFLMQGVLCILFNPTFIWLIIYCFVTVYILFGLVISYKYASYNPLFSLSGNSSVLSVFILLSLLPGGILATIPFGMMQYIRAERKMKSYYA